MPSSPQAMFHTLKHPADPGDPRGSAGITQAPSVALVEDDVDNRQSIAEALEAEGFRPRVVEVFRKPFALERLLDAVRRHA